MNLAPAVLALTLLLTAPAFGAEGRLTVAGKSHGDARVAFDLDPAWQQARGEMAGTPMIGRYSLELPGRAENEHCVLSLTASGLSVRRGQRPVVRDGVLQLQPQSWWGTGHRFRVARRWRDGAATLYRTRIGERATGVAVLPTPSWIRPVRPVTVVRIEIASRLTVMAPDPRGGFRLAEPTPSQRAACDAFVRRTLGPALTRALRSARVERRTS